MRSRTHKALLAEVFAQERCYRQASLLPGNAIPPNQLSAQPAFRPSANLWLTLWFTPTPTFGLQMVYGEAGNPTPAKRFKNFLIALSRSQQTTYCRLRCDQLNPNTPFHPFWPNKCDYQNQPHIACGCYRYETTSRECSTA